MPPVRQVLTMPAPEPSAESTRSGSQFHFALAIWPSASPPAMPAASLSMPTK